MEGPEKRARARAWMCRAGHQVAGKAGSALVRIDAILAIGCLRQSPSNLQGSIPSHYRPHVPIFPIRPALHALIPPRRATLAGLGLGPGLGLVTEAARLTEAGVKLLRSCWPCWQPDARGAAVKWTQRSPSLACLIVDGALGKRLEAEPEPALRCPYY